MENFIINDWKEFERMKEKCSKYLEWKFKISHNEVLTLMDEKDVFEKKWYAVQDILDEKIRNGNFFNFSRQALLSIVTSKSYTGKHIDINSLNLDDDDFEMDFGLNSNIETDFEKDRHRGLNGFFSRLIDNNLISIDKLDEKMEGKLLKESIPFFYRRLLLESDGGAEDINEIVKINSKALLIDKNERISHVPSNIILRWAN